MKILRTLPFVLAALFVVWGSIAGGPASFPLVLALFLTVMAAVVSGFGYVDEPAKWGSWELAEAPRLRKRRRIIVGLSLSVMFSISTLQWPLRACFWLSWPALERIAQQARRGPIETPQSVGPFTISNVRVRGGNIELWLGGDSVVSKVLVLEARGQGHAWSGAEMDRVELGGQWCFYSER